MDRWKDVTARVGVGPNTRCGDHFGRLRHRERDGCWIVTGMAIQGLHIPHGERQLAAVAVDERNAISYYPYVQGGPVEAGHLSISGLNLAVYVNSRYLTLDESMVNPRASALFEMAGVGMAGGAIRGDALVVLAPGDRDYERSLPAEVLEAFLATEDSE